MNRSLDRARLLLVLICLPAEVAAQQPPGLQELVRHSGSVNVLAFSPDGKFLYSGCAAGIIHGTDLATGKKIRTWEAHVQAVADGRVGWSPPRGVLALAFSGDATTLYSSGFDGRLLAWKIADGSKCILENRGGAAALALSPDGKLLAATSYYWDIRLIDLTTKKIRTMRGKPERVTAAVFSPDGKTLFTAGVTENKTDPTCTVLEADWIRTWDVASGDEGPSLPTKAHRLTLLGAGNLLAAGVVLHLDTGPNPRGAIVRGNVAMNTGYITQLCDGRNRTNLWSLSGHGDLAAASQDGKFLATAPGNLMFFELGLGGANQIGPDRYEEHVALFDLRTRQLVLSFPVAQATALTLCPEGKRLALATSDGKVLLCDLERAKGSFFKPITPRDTWIDLAGKPWPFCYRSMWRLRLRGKATLDLFAEKMLVPNATDSGGIAKAMAALDSARFTTRERAFKDLIAVGPAAVPQIRRALAAGAPIEAVRRLRQLLERYEDQAGASSPEIQRHHRAIAILEELNNPDALALLQQVVERTPFLEIHKAAREALRRIEDKIERGKARNRLPR
jgi:WD40 repeat protein